MRVRRPGRARRRSRRGGPRRRPARATVDPRAAAALEPEGTEAEAAFLRSALASLVERVRSWDEPKQDALAAAHEPAFWQSEERHQVLGLIEYLDRLGAATATAERLGGAPLLRARRPLA